jgi:predicted glutamine amidotransferase
LERECIVCRLFAYVHAGPPASMQESLGSSLLEQFQNLAEVHRDGWGAAWRGSDGLSHYLSTRPADQDRDLFGAIAARVVRAAVVHERWASRGITLSLDNQQPFASGGIAFAHNGTISNASGNVVRRPFTFREALGLAGSTTMSDSKLYAELFLARLKEIQLVPGTGQQAPVAAELRQAVAAAIGQLRREYPDAGYNVVIQTDTLTLAVEAHAEGGPSADVVTGYRKAGWNDRVESYADLLYSTIPHADGTVTTAASSSGYAASDHWTRLGNNKVLVISHDTAGAEVFPL